MALRVLLADESSTIKKVISLALQDFAVEVKVVHSGVDVVEVAKQFNPDIILADVLLQKKNGYEVCFDIKNDPALAKIPVILMWSSFMDLDEKAYQKSKANAKLEKPFEVDDLRKLINTFATKTREQTASGFLKFPSNMTEPLKNEQREKESKSVAEDTFSRLGIPAPPPNNRMTGNVIPPTKTKSPGPVTAPPKSPANWNMDSFDDIQVFTEQDDDPAKDLNKSLEDFSELRLTPPSKNPENTNSNNFKLSDNAEAWEQKDLSNFKIDTSDEADPFTMMDLGKVEVTHAGQKDMSSLSVTSSGKKASVPKGPPGKNESFQSFDFADSESLNLELDDSEPIKPSVVQTADANSSSWNFKLPEHEVSPIKPGGELRWTNRAPPMSQGRATYTMEFKHYSEAPKNVAEAIITSRAK